MDGGTGLLAVVAVTGALLTAVLGWLLGRSRGARALEITRAVATDARRRAAAAERELAAIRVKRDQKITELLEQLNLVEADRKALMGEVAGLKVDRQTLEGVLRTERLATRDRLALLQEATHKLESVFKTLSAEALRLGQQTQALDQLIRPLQEGLARYDQELRQMEERRAELYGSLRERLEEVSGAQQRLQLDTGSFVQALLYERLTKLVESFEELRRALERSIETDVPLSGRRPPDLREPVRAGSGPDRTGEAGPGA